MRKRLLSTLLALCMIFTLLPGTAWAAGTSGSCGPNARWSYSNGTLIIQGSGSMNSYDRNDPPWHDYRTKIHIIKIDNGVTSIGDCSFFDYSNVTSVTIPDSVTSIGDDAFNGCGLTSVSIPNSVTRIGGGAFGNCDSLTNVTIPIGVTTIDGGAFINCNNLTRIDVTNGNPAYSSIDGVLFDASHTLLHTFPKGKNGNSYRIPDSVTSIGKYAFFYCGNLTSVIIPENVTSIGDYAFDLCSGLPSVTLSDKITNIGYAAFYNCGSLTTVTIPDSVTSIKDSAFGLCNSLKDVYYSGNENQWKQITIGNNNEPLSSATIHCNRTESNEEITWQGHRYQIFSNLASTWMEAKAYCESLGGHLATISCKEENDVIYQLVTSAGYTSAYFGLTDRDREGTWTWVTGEAVTYANWHSGEPNSENANEDYGMFYYKYKDGTWNDGNFGSGGTFICEWEPTDNESSSDQISDEMILRAKILTQSNSFSFYRDWDTPIQITAQLLDPNSASVWYVIENLLDVYYKGAMNGDTSADGVGEVTSVEFYEYLLIKLLDGKEMNYLSVTEPYKLIDDISGEAVDTALLKKLVSSGFKAGTKISSNDKSKIKEICVAVCGTDSVLDVGWMDAILVSGKTIDEFASEFVSLYRLTTVSDARTEAIRMIGANTTNSALRTASQNVCSSIHRAKEEGIEYCVSGGLEESMDYISTWILNKMVDALCEIHPASKLWKATADATIFAMDTIFLTDDVATDTLYILSMANVERAILSAIDQAEQSFTSQASFDNAQRLVALAECYKQELLVGCDLVKNLVNHSERGNLNWNGILDLLTMIQKKKVDFSAALKFLFGDPDSSYTHMKDTLQDIKTNIEGTDFYSGTDILSVLQEVKSTTPSDWAVAEIRKAIDYNLLPEEMQNNYQSNITRLEFSILLEYMIEEKSDKSIYALIEEHGTLIQLPFDDALYADVNTIARLGIINGVGDNKFNPLGEITRQEAAKMLYQTAKALGYDTKLSGIIHDGVASWATQGVDFVVTNNIMNGVGNGFSPEGKYTKEQAILTLVRFYENIN